MIIRARGLYSLFSASDISLLVHHRSGHDLLAGMYVLSLCLYIQLLMDH